MRIKRPVLRVLAVALAAFFLLVIVTEVMARGPGGGGRGGRGGGPRGGHRMGGPRHHRMGPARGGSFRSRSVRRPAPSRSTYRPPRSRPQPRPATTSRMPSPQPRQPAAVPPEVRREQRQEMRQRNEERRDEMRDRREYRREERRDAHRDNYRYRRYREELGTTYTSDYWDDDYCEAEVVVDGVTFFECDGVWYRRVYSGGEVNYVVVEGPRSE